MTVPFTRTFPFPQVRAFFWDRYSGLLPRDWQDRLLAGLERSSNADSRDYFYFLQNALLIPAGMTVRGGRQLARFRRAQLLYIKWQGDPVVHLRQGGVSYTLIMNFSDRSVTVTLATDEAERRRIFAELKAARAEETPLHSDVSPTTAADWMRVYAILSPEPVSREEIRDAAAQAMGLAPEHLEAVLNRVLAPKDPWLRRNRAGCYGPTERGKGSLYLWPYADRKVREYLDAQAVRP